MQTQLEDYTVGWICAIDTEYVVACELLDEEFDDDNVPHIDILRDRNIYTFGRIHGHNVVIACLPDGRYGLTSAAVVAERMRSSFPALRFGLMVGIAGAAPSPEHDVRLGDVVVSSPTSRHGGVIQYDFVKAIQAHEFEEIGHLAPPPDVLLNAISKIKAQHKRHGHQIAGTVEAWLQKRAHLREEYGPPEIKTDRLYKVSYVHSDQGTCDCLATEQNFAAADVSNSIAVFRQDREGSANGLRIHYGLVASSNRLMKDAFTRDTVIKKHNVLCFEMEAAGLMNSFPCLVIRGICDYSDTHKNDRWQGYAAATAAAYAKELLQIIPCQHIGSAQFPAERSSTAIPSPNKYYSLQDTIAQADAAIRTYYTSSDRLRIERLSGETLSLEQCYINLALKKQPDEKQNKNDRSLLSLKERLWQEENYTEHPIAIGDLFDTRVLPDGGTVEPRRIFIQGRAGIGKTTLCKKIVYEFLQQRLGQKSFDRLLWLSLRNLENKGAKYEWLEFLQDAFTPSPQAPYWDSLIVILSQQLLRQDFRSRTLVLMDGLDEFSHPRDSKVCKFLETIICDMPNIIITSRPQANKLKIGQFYLQLETVGFTRDQIDTYVEHCVSDRDASSRIKELIIKKPILRDLLRIPVQLDAFCCTWHSEGSHEQSELVSSAKNEFSATKEETLSTMTTLYSSIIVELCRKDLIRIGRYDQSHTLRTNDVLLLLADELKFLEELAFQGLVNGIAEFHPRHQELIDIHFKQSKNNKLPLSYSSTLEQLSFLRTSGLQQHPHKRIYHFLHLTFQEFFAARHYVRNWQTNTDLICLDLSITADTVRTAISLERFLRVHRYNPRHNIFWRFVTGLVQIQQGQEMAVCPKSKTIVEFFNEFDGKSRDLLGAAHHRQLMYFLSELLPNKKADVMSMRANIEHLLYQGTITEYESVGHIKLGREYEFPENDLCYFLQDETHLPYANTLSALEGRPLLGLVTLRSIFKLTTNKFATDLRLRAIKIIFRNTRAESLEIVAHAARNFCTILEDTDWSIRWQAVESLKRYNNSLHQEVITALATALKDENQYVRRDAAAALSRHSPLEQEVVTTIAINLAEQISKNLGEPRPGSLARQENSALWRALKKLDSLHQTALTALITILNHEDYSVRLSAINRLKEQLDLSTNAIVALNTALKEEGSVMRFYITYALKDQKSLSQETVESMITLQRKWMQRRSHILDNRSEDSVHPKPKFPFPPETISTLILALDDENVSVRSSATYAIEEQFLLLDEDAVAALITVLKKNKGNQEYSRVRRCAVLTLGGQSSLPKEAFLALLASLKDEDLRGSAAHTLEQQSSLPQYVIEALNTILKDEDRNVRCCAASIMRKHSSQENIAALVIAANDEDQEVRSCAMDALAGQSSLPQEAVAALIPVLITTFLSRSCLEDLFATALLKRLVLSEEDVTALSETFITGLNDEDEDMRYCAARQLWALPHLPQETIKALIPALKDEDWQVRHGAARVLARQPSLPQRIITSLIAALKEEDPKIRRAAIDVLVVFQDSLPRESATALLADLIIVLKDQDSRARFSAAEILSRRHDPSQEAIAALTTALKDKSSDVRLSAAEALFHKDDAWRILSPDVSKSDVSKSLTAAEIVALKSEDPRVRRKSVDVLVTRSKTPPPLPQEVITALITALDDEESYIVSKAALALDQNSKLPSSLPREVITALIIAFKDGVYDDIDSIHWLDHPVSILRSQSPLPQEVIPELVVALRDREHPIRQLAVNTLEKQSHLPQEVIMPLITALGDEYQDIRYHAKEILNVHLPLLSRPQEAIMALITMLGEHGNLVYDLLYNNKLFHSSIKDLDDRLWQQLWSYWRGDDSAYNFCCYELEGALYLWSKGEMRQISDEPLRTQKMLQVVLGKEDQKPQAQNVTKVDPKASNSGIAQRDKADRPVASRSKLRSVFQFRKKDR